MKLMNYDRKKATQYAKKWALGRNPAYHDYENYGGDCTNFASQCIFAGCGQMNYGKTNGWYYINGNDKSPSWTGVEFLYNFLISNKGAGPSGAVAKIDELQIGDIIQLSFDGVRFSHTLVVVKNGIDVYDTLIASHTYDAFGKRVGDYIYDKYRCVHIMF